MIVTRINFNLRQKNGFLKKNVKNFKFIVTTSNNFKKNET